MKHLKNILVPLFVTLTLGCNNNDKINQKVEFTEIGKGQLFSPYQKNDFGFNLVIDNLTDWNSLIKIIDSPNNNSSNFTEINIDFSTFQVIAVFDQVHNNGGWSIDVTNITENEDTLNVYIENLQKGDLTQVLTQPFHIIKIPKMNKEIVFK
ncbi:MAG: protease complex subunit PrcB family protein [Flavobacteriaceae bacterium]|nr:protease complex subunit PrcB family protein [Flavobacteriaceae bacterium]